MGDEDCKCLQTIWEGIEGINVVELNRENPISKEELNSIIEQETDLLICCGHGSPSGLFNPLFKNFSYAFGEEQMAHVKAKNFFGMWCHASDFAKYNGMVGFFTSMFISNPVEASFNGIHNVTQEYVNAATINFCKKVNELIREGKDVELWRDELMKVMDENNPVDVFNYNGLYMSDGTKVERPTYNYNSYEDYDFGEIWNDAEDSVYYFGEYTNEDIITICDDYAIETENLKHEYENKCKRKIKNVLKLYGKEVDFRPGECPYAAPIYTDKYEEIEIRKIWYDSVTDNIYLQLLDYETPFSYEDCEVVPYDILVSIGTSIDHVVNKD